MQQREPGMTEGAGRNPAAIAMDDALPTVDAVRAQASVCTSPPAALALGWHAGKMPGAQAVSRT